MYRLGECAIEIGWSHPGEMIRSRMHRRLRDREIRSQRLIVAALGCILVLVIAACERTAPTYSHGESVVVDHVTFVDQLRQKGLTIEISGEVEQPFLKVKGILLEVSGGDLAAKANIQSFEYEDAASAEAEAKRLGPRGAPREVLHITWLAPPHFFQAGCIIILYVGNDEALLALLTELLGPQFASE